MSNGVLKVDGDKVVDSNGKAVVLRGADVGGVGGPHLCLS